MSFFTARQAPDNQVCFFRECIDSPSETYFSITGEKQLREGDSTVQAIRFTDYEPIAVQVLVCKQPSNKRSRKTDKKQKQVHAVYVTGVWAQNKECKYNRLNGKQN